MIGGSEKAEHYISLLNDARVKGLWSEIPELIRKVNKHAAQRKFLTLTAAAEYDVVATSNAASRRPMIDQGSQSQSLILLSNALQANEGQNAETSFQGKTCLLWSRWVGLQLNTGTPGFDVVAAMKELEDENISLWTKICIVKSAYIEGTSHVRNRRPMEAQRIFAAALSKIQPNHDLVLSTPQFAYWSEQLIAQFVLGSSKVDDPGFINQAQVEAFGFWTAIVSKTREVLASTFGDSNAHAPRLPVWKKYYEYFSTSLQTHKHDTTTPNTPTRLQQATEIRKVERAYENELLRVTKFPTATETNVAMEQWVEQAISNWQTLCGSQWKDTELGEGGRNATSREMLDILYRAAAKTFHSALILRRLFQVHLSLGEFDLAYRAFDTYIELVDRGRLRVAKSGKPEPGHESDKIVLTTVSEAITGLCKYGRRAEARKAHDLCLKLEDWLVSLGIEADSADHSNEIPNGHPIATSAQHILGPNLLQVVYRAIGVAKANWARWTPVNENRSALQEEALMNLRYACSEGEFDIETLYSTSLLLAETRDISGAILAAKQALANDTSHIASPADWTTERKLISVWHLLALLLSSRQDFDSAAKGCVAAFEQFATTDLQLGPGSNASISSNIESQFNTAVSSFVSEMECDELQRIIEVRITELALTELVDGPEEAVNLSNELLALFSRLFAHFQVPVDKPAVTRGLMPPKSSAGTVKSARTSIFHRKRHEGRTGPLREMPDDVVSTVADTTQPSTHAGQAPLIHVTTEDEKPVSKKHHLRKSYDSSRSRNITDRHSKRLSHRGGGVDKEEKDSQIPGQAQTLSPSHKVHNKTSENLRDGTDLATPSVSRDHEKSTESRQEVSKIDQNLDTHNALPPPESRAGQTPRQDVRLPTLHTSTNATSPPSRFPKSYAQKQGLAVLAKVWLIIAKLYRRANMFEDSKEACEEAGKAAAKIEAIVSGTDHAARALADSRWGAGSKSADEVWADVYCERAEVQLAIYKHKMQENPSTTNEDLRAAVEQYEQCLMFDSNHSGGIVGLSNVLLDSYERKVDLGRRVNDGRLQLIEQEHNTNSLTSSPDETPTANGTIHDRGSTIGHHHQPSNMTAVSPSTRPDDDLKKTPENLNRIAGRERAYGLLSTLTKSGTGWDDSAAWFALARAHELGGEIGKAEDVLWWCIELEDTKPIRHWRNLGYCL